MEKSIIQPNSEILSFSRDQILEYLPHRPPFLLLDGAPRIVVGEKIEAYKYINPEEPVLQGHFPGDPVYPGVYIIEGIAQAAAVLTFLSRVAIGLEDIRFAFLTGVDEARFRKPVYPGDTLEYSVSLIKLRNYFAWLDGVAKVNDEIVAEVKISARIASGR